MPGTLHTDVLVVGGGAAGLSAALVLGRACRPVLVVDAGGQSNRRAPAVGGLIGWEGTPGDLVAHVWDQLRRYPDVTLRPGTVVDLVRADPGFAATLDDGGTVLCDRVLLATGMHYDRPDLPGLEELWGGPVFHCPYCHGWELRDRPLGVLGGDVHAAHRALMLREWSREVLLVTGGGPAPDGPAGAALAAAGIPVVTTPVARLDARRGGLDVALADGIRRPLDGLLVEAPMRRRTDLGLSLGVRLAPGGRMETGDDLQTSVPGLYAAGDVTNDHGQVVLAAAAGARAAMEIHAGLVDDRWGWRGSGGG